MQAIPTCGA